MATSYILDFENNENPFEMRKASIKDFMFDYTKWQAQYFDNMTVEEFNSAAVGYAKNNPHTGIAKIVL